MKTPIVRRCPKCNSTFTNDSYTYCLDDGTKLVEDRSTQFDPNAETIHMDKPTRSRFKVIKRQFHFSEGDTSREIAYPQLQGLNSEYLQRRINNYLRVKFLALGQDELVPQDEQGNFVEVTGYGVSLLTPLLLSTKLWRSFDFGGAHPANNYQAFNVDLASGYVFTYEDLFKLDSDYKTLIPELITTSLQKQAEKEEYEYYPFSIRDEYDFYITRKNLVLFNLYSSHAVQSLESAIRLSEIRDLIHPEGPLFALLGN